MIAEAEGFEPPDGLPSSAFKADAFGRSATLPWGQPSCGWSGWTPGGGGSLTGASVGAGRGALGDGGTGSVGLVGTGGGFGLCQGLVGSILVTERPAGGYLHATACTASGPLGKGRVVRCRLIRTRRCSSSAATLRSSPADGLGFDCERSGRTGSSDAQAPATPLPRTPTLLNVSSPDVS